MARYTRLPFQVDKPIFCKIPIPALGRVWGVDSHFKWQEMRMPMQRIARMYVQGNFYHSDELEEKISPVIGDGLEEMNRDALHALVDSINKMLKETNDDRFKNFVRKSNIKDKQIGLLRSWRRNFGHLETK